MSQRRPRPPVLHLRLEPAHPTRVSRASRSTTAGRGYRLLLDGRVPIAHDDPLLASFGARVVSIGDAQAHADVLQDDAFCPGKALQLELAPTPDDRNHVAVWDAEGVLCAGCLKPGEAAQFAAAIDHGLAITCVSLWERRHLGTGDRIALRVLLAPAAFIDIRLPDIEPADVERLASRPRIVLVAGRDGTLRWWDPSARRAPLAVDELPMSPDLADALRELERDWEHSAEEDDDELGGFGFLTAWERGSLEERARALWRRARDELAPRYAVGWKPAGAERAIYAEAERRDDVPF